MNVSYAIGALAHPTATFCIEIEKRSSFVMFEESKKKRHLPLPNFFFFFGTFLKKIV